MKLPVRLGISVAIPFVIVFAGGLFLTSQVEKKLLEIDPDAQFRELRWGTDAVFLGSLSMPGLGIQADSVWVFVEGVPFHPVPSTVVIKSCTVDPILERDSSLHDSGSTSLPPVSIQDAFLPDGSDIFANRSGGTDVISASGLWGECTFRRQGESFKAVFSRISSFPQQTAGIPPLLQGHTVSGYCSGVYGDSICFSGVITGFDGRSASAIFDYSLMRGGVPNAGFRMDFSQVSAPAMALLDSISGGAVMTAVPSGSLQVNVRGPDTVFFASSLSFDSMVVFSRSVAPDTFTTAAFLQFSGFILPGDDYFRVDTGLARIGEAESGFDLSCSWGNTRRLVINAYNSSLSGEAITASVPDQLLGRLRGLSLSGEISFYVTLVLDWNQPDSCDVQIDVDASGLNVGWSPVSFSSLIVPSGASCTMRDSWGNTRVIALDTLYDSNFVVFDSIPFFFEPLLCCAEDASFRRHHGFSEYHIRNSIRTDMEEGRFVRGGSTISMQLAKNLFLGREKTLARKLQEVFLTWRLERWLSKNRIIELYANIVELGPGVFGFNSAALYYFNKPFGELSVRETAFLVSILPGPRIYHQYGVRGRLPAFWDSYVDRLITICGNRGWLDNQLVSGALADTLIFNGPVSGTAVNPGGSQSN